MKNENVLKAIVCGYERGGTTLINKLLSAHPELSSGFESGLLLADTPQHYLSTRFKEFNDSLIKNGWQIDDEDLAYICSSSDWSEAYSRLRQRAGVVVDKSSYIFDKTPKYMVRLSEVLTRIDSVPCVVVVRRPEAVIYSWLKRREDIDIKNPGRLLLWRFCQRYNKYAKGYAKAKNKFPERIHTVKYEELCANTDNVVRGIFSHLGYQNTSVPLGFDAEYGVRGNRVSIEYVNEYQQLLPAQVITSIQRMTRNSIELLGL
jgi:hypothetical protein